MPDIERAERKWTLTASNRLGTVGAPIVDHGPRIEPYTSVEVVPASELRGAVEDRDEAIRLLRAAHSPPTGKQRWFAARDALLARHPAGGQ